MKIRLSFYFITDEIAYFSNDIGIRVVPQKYKGKLDILLLTSLLANSYFDVLGK